MNTNPYTIYNHPLFPLLKVLFEKCELATNSIYSIGPIDHDIIDFSQNLMYNNKLKYYSSDNELDNFIIQSIEILRIHLLEIAKVHELCDNFCQKYIHLLKDKFSVKDILIDDTQSEDESVISNDEYESFDSSESIKMLTSPKCLNKIEENIEQQSQQQQQRKKRGVLPKSATTLLRTWLFQNLNHPYPTEEQKKSLAKETNLNILQVNNWFINARRRIVQPMIDQSNRTAMLANQCNDCLTINPYTTIDLYKTSYDYQTRFCNGTSTNTTSYSFPIEEPSGSTLFEYHKIK